jgi:hypothetical protein
MIEDRDAWGKQSFLSFEKTFEFVDDVQTFAPVLGKFFS